MIFFNILYVTTISLRGEGTGSAIEAWTRGAFCFDNAGPALQRGSARTLHKLKNQKKKKRFRLFRAKGPQLQANRHLSPFIGLRHLLLLLFPFFLLKFYLFVSRLTRFLFNLFFFYILIYYLTCRSVSLSAPLRCRLGFPAFFYFFCFFDF